MRLFLIVILFTLAGCATYRGTPANDFQAVANTIDQVFDAAQRNDFVALDNLHAYGPAFTKFGSELPGRQDADFARDAEHRSLGAVKITSMRAEDLKVDFFRDIAIATFILRFSFSVSEQVREQSARTTMVFVKSGPDWKITHEHLSPLPAR